MDDQVVEDSTLEEIFREIKRSHFRKLKILCVLTGASILLSLGLVFFNGFQFDLKISCVIIVSLVNITTISWAIVFIISIIDPDKITKTAKKLIKESKGLFEIERGEIGNSIKIGDFIEKFVQLEKIIRELDLKSEFSYFLRDKYKYYIPISEFFKLLFQLELIDSQTLRDLHEVNKVRNLAAHGQIDSVDERISNMLSDLIRKIEMVKPNSIFQEKANL